MARNTVAVIGLGRVGLPTAIHLASLGHRVRGYDTKVGLVADLLMGKNPLPWEPGMELGSVDYCPDLDDALRGADMALVCVPTPLEQGPRLSSELVRQAVSEIELRSPALIVIVSTLDPRDTAVCGAHMVYNPPLIRLGHVREDLENASLLLLGGEADLCQTVQDIWYPQGLETAPGLLTIHQQSGYAEGAVAVSIVKVCWGTVQEIALAKLAINATLSARIAWANDLALMCREQGVTPHKVLDIVTADPRIGAAYMRPGAPPGGPCLPRDLAVWSSLANKDYLPDNTLANAVLDHHGASMDELLLDIGEQLLALAPKPEKVAILGATYVPGALDTTFSPGNCLARDFAPEFTVWLADPAMDYLGESFPFRTGSDAQAAVDWADAVVVCTRWPEFDKLDFRGKPVIYGR